MKIFITSIFILISLALTAQSTKRIVRQMDSKDFEKGKELALSVLEDAPEDPAANFCMAWMTFEQENFFDAYKHMILFKSNINSLEPGDKEEIMAYMENVMTKMRKKSFDERIEKKSFDIEQAAINYVREKRDPEIASQYIELFPTSPFLDNTKHIRNHYAYINAIDAGTVEAMRKFKQEYPDAAQQEVAQERIHELEFEAAKNSKSIDRIETFIQSYPLAKQRTEAIQLRNQWAYNEAKKNNDLEAIEKFIRDYPNAIQAAEAQQLKQKLVFEKAKSINTIEAYSDFVKQYPFGKYYVDIFNLKSKALGARIAENSQIKNAKTARAFDYNKTNDLFSTATIDKNGNIFIAGIIELDTIPLHDVWLMKLDPTGKMLWNKQFGSPANDHINELFIQDDGSLLGIGIYGQTDTTHGQGWMLSVGADGKKQWMKFLGDLYPVSSLQKGNEIIVGGYNMDSLHHMRLIKFDNEADKKWQRKYTTRGSVNAVKPHSQGGTVISGKNWIAHISDEGYLEYDQFIDENLTIMDVTEKEGVIYAAGYNEEFNLFVYNTQNKSVTQTTQQVKEIQFLPDTDLLVLDHNNNLTQLTSAGGYVKDVAKNTGHFYMLNNYLFYTSINSILQGNIQMITF
ncbi:MAG: hypothetical protein R6U85_12810 [Salinivirgaceae bacterium]